MRTAYAVRRPVANTYLVRERDRRRWRELGLVLLAVIPLGLALVFYTWIHLEVVATGYDITVMERELEELLQEERRLRLEASRLASPERVERFAVEQLGLRAPELEQMVFITSEPGGRQ